MPNTESVVVSEDEVYEDTLFTVICRQTANMYYGNAGTG